MSQRPRIAYLDGRRIRRAIRAGAMRVIAAQEHLNKINVYPVPDGDTGTNLALTMGAVHGALASNDARDASAMLNDIADAALDGARGNSGAILAQFLQGISDGVAGLGRLSAGEFAAAIESGERYARDALAQPVEGTILTVMSDFAARVRRAVTDDVHDFVELLEHGLASARTSLAETPHKLEALRRAGVVDAGAEGFVDLLEGIHEYVQTGELENAIETAVLETSAETRAGTEVDLDYRFCTECMITGDNIDRRALKESLMTLGGSLVLAGTHSKTRVHIHVNDPQKVFELAAGFGSVSGNKADDMQRQQSETHVHAQRTVVMMDSAGDIPDEDLERVGIHMTPVRLHFGRESYLDKVTITADEFYRKLASSVEAPKTSQPAPGDFRREFQFLASHYESVICVNVTGAASGTYQAAVSAAQRSGAAERVHVFDSWSVSVGQGLLALHAAECARAGKAVQEIMQSLEALRERTQIYALIRDLTAAVRGGRVSRTLKRVVDFLRLTPVLGTRGQGRLTSVGMLLGRERALQKYIQFILRRADPAKRYRLAVGYTNCPTEARQVFDALREGIASLESTYYCRVGSALGAHTGDDGLVVALQEYDGD